MMNEGITLRREQKMMMVRHHAPGNHLEIEASACAFYRLIIEIDIGDQKWFSIIGDVDNKIIITSNIITLVPHPVLKTRGGIVSTK